MTRLSVGVMNPLLGVASLLVLPMDTILLHPSDLLSVIAKESGGSSWEFIICVDAVLILCGAVLTAYIGMGGLMARLARDKIFPAVLAQLSRTGAPYVSTISFGVGAVALFLIIYNPTDPSAIQNFGGVYSISFLSVLCAFAFAAALLKRYRSNLARMVRLYDFIFIVYNYFNLYFKLKVIAKWWIVISSFLAVFSGLIGNRFIAYFVS